MCIRDSYWGLRPNDLAFEVLRLFYPTRPVRLLEVGCGEGRDLSLIHIFSLLTPCQLVDAGDDSIIRKCMSFKLRIRSC